MATKNPKQLLDGLCDRDPDLREMACRDLEKGLLGELKLSSAEEQSITSRFFEMMTKDQTLLKVLASHTLVTVINRSTTPANVSSVVTQAITLLTTKHVEDEKTIREVSTYTLKEIINGNAHPVVPASLIHAPLIAALNDRSGAVTEYALDVLETLLVKWGSHLVEESGEKIYETIQVAAVPHLQSPVYNIQTKAIGVVGNLGAFLSYDAFSNLITKLNQNLKAAKKNCASACTILSTLSTVCRLSPSRFSRFLAPLIPFINDFVQAAEFTDEAEQVKVCEAALSTFETILVHCKRLSPDLYTNVQEQALQFIAYDPTVLEGAGDDFGEAGEAEEEEYDYDDDAIADESESWRVRKACIRCLNAVLMKSDNILDTLDVIGEELIKRFTDSQVNVKIEIFKTFVQIVGLVKSSSDLSWLRRFNEWIPLIVGGLAKEFRSKGDKSKIEAFILLQEIAVASPGVLDGQFDKLEKGFVSALKDKSANLQTEASKSLRSIMQYSSQLSKYESHVHSLLVALIVAINTPNFKVTSAALRAATYVVKIIKTKDDVNSIYGPIHNILNQESAAVEVKEAVIGCAGQLVSSKADLLGNPRVEEIIKILGERLNHVTTAVAAAKAIQVTAVSNHKVSIGGLANTVIRQLVECLKLHNRQLRQNAVESLTVFVPAHNIKFESYESLLPFIEADDLLITGLVLRLIASTIKTNPAVIPEVVHHIIPKTLSVLKNPQVQGVAVGSMGYLFKTLVESKPELFDSPPLFSTLLSFNSLDHNTSVSQVIASIVECYPQKEEVVKKLAFDAKKGNPLALSALGEIGSRFDITIVSEAVDIVSGFLGTSLGSSAGASDKSVRHIAAKALGSMAVSNFSVIIDVLQKQLKKNPLYTVSAVRQLIERLSPEKVINHTQILSSLLISASEAADEATRDNIADALGKILQINPSVISVYEKEISSPSKNTRASVVKAVSLAIYQSESYYAFVYSLPHFLNGIGDKDVEVRTASLSLLQNCINKNLNLVKPYLAKYESLLSVEAKRRPELISKVVVGSNTLVTDLGLPSRRIAFQIIDTLLTSDKLSIPDVIINLGGATKVDEEVEIQTLGHRISIKLAGIYPEELLRGFGAFDFIPVFTKILPNTAIDVDIKANEEIIASARPVIIVVEDIFYSSKYASKVDSFVILETLLKAAFGGLRLSKLVKYLVAGVSTEGTQEGALKVLTDLWKLFDTKIQNNLQHKALADEVISGLDETLTAVKPFLDKKSSHMKSTLIWIKSVDVALARLDRHKKDTKVVVPPTWATFLKTITSGPLSSAYTEIK